jgi:hypothetical protein
MLSDERMIEVVRVGRRLGGAWYAQLVWLQYSRPDSLQVALEKVRDGKLTFVRREDACALLQSLKDRGAALSIGKGICDSENAVA